eukprot:403349364
MKNKRQIEIIVKFPNPKNISISNVYDTIDVVFNPGQYIAFESKLIYVQKNYKLSSKVPPQVVNSTVTKLLASTVTSLGNSMTGSFAANIILSVVLGVSLKNLWTLMNTLQLLVYLPLMSISLPFNVLLMCQALIDVVNFNVIPKDLVKTYFTNYLQGINFSIDTISDPNLNAIDIFLFMIYFQPPFYFNSYNVFKITLYQIAWLVSQLLQFYWQFL